jgi:sugar lactone lactonase YvrE
VAVDASGNIYVADQGNHKIRMISSAGIVTTLAGNGTAGLADGTGTAASFYDPTGVAVDAFGNIYVADTRNSIIRKIIAQ